MLKIITWNVNSIKARMKHLLLLLTNENPDVVLLQETKSEDVTFPITEIEDAGYNVCFFGQKSYNGVAILSKNPIESVIRGLPNFEDTEARYIEAVTYYKNHAIKVASVYVPNGQPTGEEAKITIKATESKRFKYKLGFLESLKTHLQSSVDAQEVFLIGGDINVAPFDLDVYSVKNWTGKVCFLPEEKALVRSIINLGFADTLRILAPQAQLFTWYDYRTKGFETGKGLRIDHIYCSPFASSYLNSYKVLEYYRGLEKASDHVPFEVSLNLL